MTDGRTADAARAAWQRYLDADVVDRWQMWTPEDQARRPLERHRAIMAAVPRGRIGPRAVVEGVTVTDDIAWVTTDRGTAKLRWVDDGWRVIVGVGLPPDERSFVESLRAVELMLVADAGAPHDETWTARLPDESPITLERARTVQPFFFFGGVVASGVVALPVAAPRRFFVENAVRLEGHRAIALVHAGRVFALGGLADGYDGTFLRLPILDEHSIDTLRAALEEVW